MRAIGTALFGAVALVSCACSTVRPFPSGRHGLLQDRAEGAELVSHRKGASGDEGGRVSASQLERLRKLGFRWPLRSVRVTSYFGRRSAGFHDGVDLHASVGTPVYASQGGVVLYADHRIRGYGKMVLLRHGSQLSTVYAHNSRLLVRKGQHVRKGQQIALSGKSGHATGPHLHFEIREGVSVLDPLKVLPGVRTVAGDHTSASVPALRRGRRRPATIASMR